MRKMVEEKAKNTEKKRQAEELANGNVLSVNGFSPGGEGRITAVSIRDEILNGISFLSGKIFCIFFSFYLLVIGFFNCLLKN